MVDAMSPSSFVGDDVGRAAAGSPVDAVLDTVCCLAPLLWGTWPHVSAVRAHDEWPKRSWRTFTWTSAASEQQARAISGDHRPRCAVHELMACDCVIDVLSGR